MRWWSGDWWLGETHSSPLKPPWLMVVGEEFLHSNLWTSVQDICSQILCLLSEIVNTCRNKCNFRNKCPRCKCQFYVVL